MTEPPARLAARPGAPACAQGRSGFPSPYSQSAQIPSKSFPGADFSTYAVKSPVSAVPCRCYRAQPRSSAKKASSPAVCRILCRTIAPRW